MPNLLTSLKSSASALSVFERALLVSQNNVTNASTPGYAAQRLSLIANDFEPDQGLIGGVRTGQIQSERSEYAERAVRCELESLGFFQQAAASLAGIEATFTITGESGIPGALNRLYQSFSAWSLAPNSAAARQVVIDRAAEVAESFQQTAASLTNVSGEVDQQLRQTIDQINQLGARLLEYNLERRRGGQDDAGLDTIIHTTLEELSELVDFTAIFQSDGSVTVLLGGQAPLVIGEHQYPISVSFYNPADPAPTYPGAPPTAHVLNTEGREITAQITKGKLSALLNVRNDVLPSLRGDAYQAGDLNLLAKAIADRVNQVLTAGLVSDGPPPVNGVPLFAYDTSNDALAAQSLTVDSAVTPALLAPIEPGPPYSSNGIALKLANLAAPQDDADKIDGLSFTEFYGNIAAAVGRALAEAQDNKDFKAQMVAQARSLRSELSAVSLDEEAILMVEFQRAYQATARVVSVLNDLTEITVNLLR